MTPQDPLLRTFHPGMYSTPESVARRMQPKPVTRRFIPDWAPIPNELSKAHKL